jgi:outer membrane protein assembly factor BamB
MTSEWRALGPANVWKDARAAVALDGRVFLAGADGYLHAVDGTTGESSVLGGGGWQTRILAAARGRLFAFDEAGPLYAIDPRDGGYERFDGDWAEARAAVGSDRLYVASGGLQALDCDDGTPHAVGDAEWHTELLLATQGDLFDLEEDGSLYRIQRHSGAFEQLDGDWGDVCAGVGSGQRLYLMATTGALYAVAPSGDYESIDTGTHWDTRILMASGGTLYALEHSGSLYAIKL